MGLPRGEALELASQCTSLLPLACFVEKSAEFRDGLSAMVGAARMVLQTGSHPAAIKDSVTSTLSSPPLEFVGMND
jgi:hypothetical protein